MLLIPDLERGVEGSDYEILLLLQILLKEVIKRSLLLWGLGLEDISSWGDFRVLPREPVEL